MQFRLSDTEALLHLQDQSAGAAGDSISGEMSST